MHHESVGNPLCREYSTSYGNDRNDLLLQPHSETFKPGLLKISKSPGFCFRGSSNCCEPNGCYIVNGLFLLRDAETSPKPEANRRLVHRIKLVRTLGSSAGRSIPAARPASMQRSSQAIFFPIRRMVCMPS